jgi:hypothetical protein
MIVVQEVTEWSTPYQPNNILFLSNNKQKLYAYINRVTGEQKILNSPIDFDPRYRKFELLRHVEDEQEGVAVKGSKGDIYYVTKNNGEYKCTCTGYRYHGTCKHIEKVKNERTTR